MHQHPQHLFLDAPRIDARDVRRVEVDFLVVGIQVQPGGVGYAIHFAQHEGYGARGRDARGRERGVEVREDGGDGGGEGGGGVHEAEEGVGAGAGEVAEFEPEEGGAWGCDGGVGGGWIAGGRGGV